MRIIWCDFGEKTTKNLFIVRMAANKGSQKRKKRYISKDIDSDKIFLVYVYDTDNNALVSDGPFCTYEMADKFMRIRLSEGICSWVVTYNE